MPSSRAGRAAAAVYLLAVVSSALFWVVKGNSLPALMLTLALTLPWSLLAYGMLPLAGLVSSSPNVQAVAFATLILLTFPGIAVSNVFLARALRRPCSRRRLRGEVPRAAEPPEWAT